MLASVRRSLNTWVVRLLFLVLVIAFAAWGVGDMLRVVGHDNTVATVAGRSIEPPEVQSAYQRELATLTRQLAGRMEPTAEMREAVLRQSLDQIINETLINARARAMGLAVTDDALRGIVYQMPAFQGPSGHFERAAFLAALQKNGLDEGRFLALMRDDLTDQQVLSAVRAGAVAPEILTHAIYAYEDETRIADAVDLPLAAAAAPGAPGEADLSRYWQNNPETFSSPEYRKIKAVILSVETLAKTETVSDEDMKAAYEARKAEFVTPEKRDVEVMVAIDEKAALAMLERWKTVPDWAAMKDLAKHEKISAIDLTDITAAQIPVPELARALFAAQPGMIGGPIKTDLGWYVFQVAKITPPTDRSFEQVKDELAKSVAAQKAADQLYDRANKVEDALAATSNLADLPGDLGLAAVEGSLDAEGTTKEGAPAPIPGPPELRAALIAAAFHTRPGEPPHLVEVPPSAPTMPNQAPGTSSYYAVQVESITPPALKPLDEVREAVLQDWRKAAIRHAQETAAAGLLAAVKGGTSLADAALKSGLRVRRLPAVGRAGGAEGVPSQLAPVLFGLKPGEPTMVETADGFVVAVLAATSAPDPQADPVRYGRARDNLARGIGQDLEHAYVEALRETARPRINQAVLDRIAQP